MRGDWRLVFEKRHDLRFDGYVERPEHTSQKTAPRLEGQLNPAFGHLAIQPRNRISKGPRRVLDCGMVQRPFEWLLIELSGTEAHGAADRKRCESGDGFQHTVETSRLESLAGSGHVIVPSVFHLT